MEAAGSLVKKYKNKSFFDMEKESFNWYPLDMLKLWIVWNDSCNFQT